MMDYQDLAEFFRVLNGLSPVGAVALLALSIFLWVWKNPIKPIARSVAEIKNNHLHELPELVENSRRTVDVLQRIEVKLGENFASLHTKLDGNYQPPKE